MPKTVTETFNPATGNVTQTTEIDGVRTVVTKPAIQNVLRGDLLAKTYYRQTKVWNPATQAFVTVNRTGNEAQDAALLAAAFVTAGAGSTSIVQST